MTPLMQDTLTQRAAEHVSPTKDGSIQQRCVCEPEGLVCAPLAGALQYL